jgi:hypothetical protein
MPPLITISPPLFSYGEKKMDENHISLSRRIEMLNASADAAESHVVDQRDRNRIDNLRWCADYLEMVAERIDKLQKTCDEKTKTLYEWWGDGKNLLDGAPVTVNFQSGPQGFKHE